MLGEVARVIMGWPRTPIGIAFGALLAVATLCVAVLAGSLVALLASVVLADDGSEAAQGAHRQIRVGMSLHEINDITARLPHVSWGCTGSAQPSYPPCRSAWVQGQGSWLSSYSFRVSLDERGVVTNVTPPEYDAW
jgi:hypothetical protein